MTYEISWSNGRSDEADTFDEAIALVKKSYPHMVFERGEDRTLCWEDRHIAENDPGVYAVCSIEVAS